MDGKRDRFAVLDRVENKIVALWCSGPKTVVHVEDGRFYRIDYLEVSPQYRQTAAGLFVLALIASRALEVGAGGLVLGAFPVEGLHRFYTEAGGVQRSVRGWKPARNLLPYVFGREALERLKELADGLVDES